MKDHKCHIMPRKQKGGIYDSLNCKNNCTYSEKYNYFDYESQQDTGIHIPNLIIAQYFDGSELKFENKNDFCKWLISKKQIGFTCIAHNSKSYDSHFI